MFLVIDNFKSEFAFFGGEQLTAISELLQFEKQRDCPDPYKFFGDLAALHGLRPPSRPAN
jgi:hypothetical protein